ncbi:hypothetical protein LEP1GSC175_0178 [Leptospira santarosai str. HAI821]|uniref:Uncharacterized protein n=1 Tax=Leptospira santarosai str. ZUN179 TaxID=1049985 RepID=M6V1B9_9LEPT|nr:hypothetical protein [Leptospira santarosai]EMO31142.1 hypothetical protein LEP1GSC175_0178 [Leptospira santarosai str. HAI821]EMO43353.1 hypothetical protein LEP1GSC187_0576 [Leptospira santarosai str. ZUN179]
MSLEKTIRYFLSIDRFFQRNQTGTPMKQSGFYLFPEVELYGVALRSFEFTKEIIFSKFGNFFETVREHTEIERE